jgi:hypothetical protein
MQHVQLSDRLYKDAQRRAAEAGFSSVDAFIAEVVSHNLHDESEDLDHLFTPERIARLDRISAEIKAGGKTYTMEEVREHFEKKRKTWLENHAI